MIQQHQNILLVGAPGVGKTAILREMARVLSDYQQQRVMVIDTSNEIAGDEIIMLHHVHVCVSRHMMIMIVVCFT